MSFFEERVRIDFDPRGASNVVPATSKAKEGSMSGGAYTDCLKNCQVEFLKKIPLTADNASRPANTGYIDRHNINT